MKRYILKNAAWLFFDRIFRMTLSLMVSILLVRYLGPTQFGQLNYALAYVGLFGALISFGFNDIVVRDLVREGGSGGEIMASAFLLQFIAATIGLGFLVVMQTFFATKDLEAQYLIFLFGLTLLFKPADVVKYWFESRIESRVVVWVENTVFFIFAVIKILLIMVGAKLITLAVVICLEAVSTAIFLMLSYFAIGGGFDSWKITKKRVLSLIFDSWPLALSSVAILIYMRVDQVMIGNSLGDTSVGIFSAASRLCEVWYFIPMVISSSIFPILLGMKADSQLNYEYWLQRLYDFMVVISVVVAIFVTIFSTLIIDLLYGPEYAESAKVLAVMIWSGVFVSLGVARGKWMITEGLQHIGWFYAVAALLMNVVCNYIFIDVIGVVGSALASLMAQLTSVILAPALHPKTRPSVCMMLSSMNPLRLQIIIQDFYLIFKKLSKQRNTS